MADQIPVMEAEFTLMRRRFKQAGLRSSQRYRCPLATLGRLIFPGEDKSEDVWVQDLSKIGVGLGLNRALEVSTALRVRLKAEAQVIEVDAVVAHSTQLIDGTWRVGCAFGRKLTAEELETLL
jgi:hypothetical protein